MPTPVPSSDLPGSLVPQDDLPSGVDSKLGIPTSLSRGGVAQAARKRLADLLAERAKTEYAQDIANIRAKGAGMVAEAIPFALAAPFTGGASLLPATALLGATGLASGLARETTKAAMGSTDLPGVASKDVTGKKALMLTLGIDTGFGATGELVGRAIGYGGRKLIPSLIEKSAAKSEAGAKLLADSLSKSRNDLNNALLWSSRGGYSNPVRVNITKPLNKALNRLNYLSAAEGELGEMYGRLSPRAYELKNVLVNDLAIVDPALFKKPSIIGGGMREALGFGKSEAGIVGKEAVEITVNQPINGILTVRDKLQKILLEDKSIRPDERHIFNTLIKDLDSIVTKEISKVSPYASALWSKTKKLYDVERDRQTAFNLADGVIHYIAVRMIAGPVIGGTLGGAYGAHQGGVANIIGGVGIGMMAGAIPMAIPRLSSLVLEQVMKHPQASTIYRRAIDLAVSGNYSGATTAAIRAVDIAHTRGLIRDAVRHHVEGLAQTPRMGRPPAIAD